MKVYKKPLLVCIMLLFLLIGVNTIAYGTETKNISLAEYLNKVGLLQGTGNGFELSKNVTRAEGAIMVVRLLGKEEVAKAHHYEHPFVDVPTWADDYIGYLWQNNISKGLDATHYGSNQKINASEFMTFLVRVIGYDDSKGDFSWQNSLQKAYTIGMISNDAYNQYKQKTTFLREDMVNFSYAVLGTDLKDGQGISLIRKLMDEGTVPQTAMLDYQYAPYLLKTRNYAPKNDKEIIQSIVQSMMLYEDKLTIDIKNCKTRDIEGDIETAYEIMEKLPGYFTNISGSSYYEKNGHLYLEFDYYITKSERDRAVISAKGLAKTMFSSKMTDYERELKIHDYIVDQTSYHIEGSQSFNMVGVFNDHKAVCGGYAEAFNYLATLAGLDSRIVIGEGISEGETIGHAWNAVEIQGQWYQVDPTWDDPVMPEEEQRKSYIYLNITDDEMDIDHNWERRAYPAATATAYNYYAINQKTVEGVIALKYEIEKALENKEEEISFKVVGEDITQGLLKTILSDTNKIRACTYYTYEDLGVVEISDIKYR